MVVLWFVVKVETDLNTPINIYIYPEYIIKKHGLEEAQLESKLLEKYQSHLRYADDTFTVVEGTKSTS